VARGKAGAAHALTLAHAARRGAARGRAARVRYSRPVSCPPIDCPPMARPPPARPSTTRPRRLVLALVSAGLAASLAASLAGCSAKGSGNRRSESRPVATFTEVRVEGFIDLEVTQGATPTLVLEADDNLLPRV